MAKTSEKNTIMTLHDHFVPYSRAQLINEVATMAKDWNELFSTPSRLGEALVEKCEAECDIPYEEGREALKQKGKELHDIDTHAMDIVGNEDGKPLCMYDFIASDVEYVNGKIREGTTVDKLKRASYLYDIGYEDDIYADVNVHDLFYCQDCPMLQMFDRMECYQMARRKKRHGYFFPFDMRTIRFETNSELKEHIKKHLANREIEKVKRVIDGKKVSGFFIECTE